MWRTGKLLALIVLAGVLGTLATAVPASATDEADEWSLVALVNQSRAQAGLAPLAVLGGLRDLGRAQAARMAQQNSLFHDPNLVADVAAVAPDWQRAAENVGMGTDAGGLHAAFMASPGHRA